MTPTNLTQLIYVFTNLANSVVPVLVALALLFFVWGLATFILNSGNKDEGKKGRDRMVWGLVALFVILSIGGLLAVVQTTLFNRTGGYEYNTGDNNLPLGSGVHTNPITYIGGEGFNVNPQLDNTQDRGFRYCFLGVGNNCERTWRDRWLRN